MKRKFKGRLIFVLAALLAASLCMAAFVCLTTLWHVAHTVTSGLPASAAAFSARTLESFVAISSLAVTNTPPQHCQFSISHSSTPSFSAQARA